MGTGRAGWHYAKQSPARARMSNLYLHATYNQLLRAVCAPVIYIHLDTVSEHQAGQLHHMQVRSQAPLDTVATLPQVSGPRVARHDEGYTG